MEQTKRATGQLESPPSRPELKIKSGSIPRSKACMYFYRAGKAYSMPDRTVSAMLKDRFKAVHAD